MNRDNAVSSRQLTWPIVIVGLAVAYSPMWLPRVGDVWGLRPGIEGPPASIFWNSLAAAGVCAFVVAVERRSLASIGLRRPTGKQLELALYLFGGCMTWQWIVLTFFPPQADDGTATIAALPVAVVLGMIVSAAVFEEILFRGYPIERLAELTGRLWLAFAITVPIFVAPHLVFFGTSWLWTAGVGTLVIYVLYAATRNLPACMLLHLCVNLPILIPALTGG